MRATTQDTAEDTAGRAAAGHARALAAHAVSGLVGGAVLAIALVAVESALLGAWWRGLVIPPHGLARTEMFDFLTETYALLQPALATALPAAMGGIYPPGSAGLGRLALDLARAALPMGLLLGLVLGVLRAAARRPPSAGAVVALLALAGVLAELTLWLASVHVPVSGSMGSLARGTARDFVWDGALVSLLALAPAAALAARLAPRLATRGGAAGMAVPLALLGVAFGLAGSAAGVAPEPTTSPARAVPAAAARRPNVLLVSIDSLRADRLGCYGHTRPTSPRIDRLAAGGARFAAAWSTTSWTLPAHVSMLSGRSVLGHGVLGESRIPAQVPMLAELLGAAGYTTAAFVSAPYLSSRFGFARGFDLYDDFSVPFTPDRESRERAQATVSAPLLHPGVEQWLQKAAREPFFLFLHYFDVHYDYRPPAPFDTMFDPDYAGPITGKNFHADRRIRAGMPARDLEHLLALYDGEIRFTDGYVGRVLDLLDRLGVADDTIVVLTSDHGDEFFEHGDKGHHRTLYEEVLHVPLVVAFPRRLPAGRVVSEPVSIVDIVPTVLELAGLPTPASVEGQSLVPLLDGSAPARERALVAELYVKPNLNLQVALRRNDRKLIQSLNFPHSEAYDLVGDPRERDPRRADATTAALGTDLARWLADTWSKHGALQTEPRAVALDQGQIEALRALGYVE